MARAFAEIAFTDTVRALQARQGSSGRYEAFLDADAPRADRLGPEEVAFVEGRDGFYQATVSETGWPYVQFRGGPAGFLRVLDAGTLAYADFRGNRQYLSAGNLTLDDRIALILVDYPNRRRLKVFGRARLTDEPALMSRLAVPGYRGRPERAVVIAVSGFDWNCPQHIPRRLTEEEWERDLAALRAENAALKAALDRASAA